MVVGDSKRTANIMDGIENTGDVRMHDHRLRLKQRFDIVRKLGQGTYGKVQLGINKKTGQEVAIKTIKKCKIESEADLIRIRREVQIMSSVRHPNIVHIYEVFENSEKMILVMEYCSGGELYDYLSQKKVLQEEEARRLFRQIATAVYYCHIHKICHRDLKLENVLLDDTGSAKIADFGLSNVFKETSLLSTFCGSPLYASPEIVKGTPYIGPEVDCWSLGVLLYTLVYGAMPFDGSNFKRLVRQISNGDYYEPRTPSTASPLIRDMLTVDPLKRADIAYICDNPWVNTGCETSCLEMAEALAAETPVRLDLLLSLAPAAPSNSNSVMVPAEAELGPEESGTDLTSSVSMPVEPSNSAEKRILDLVAEGGEDAIKPSPTRTIVTAGENKRKLELAMSASGLQRKKERVASVASMGSQAAALPEEAAAESPLADDMPIQPSLKSSATITIAPAPEIALDPIEPTKQQQTSKDEPPSPTKEKTGAKPRIAVKKKTSPTKTVEDKTTPDKEEAKQQDEPKPSAVAAAADKLTSLSIAQTPETKTPVKPKKLSIPGGNVGSFKDQFERRASLTTAPEIKRNISKPVVSKIAKPKAQSEDRELPSKMPQDNGTVRLQQIGIEPSPTPPTESEPNRGGVKKTESEPTHGVSAADPSVLLQDARRSLQNSMAKLVEEKAGEESRRRAARDIISSAIRTGKPPVPYGRSSSAGVTMLSSPPGTPPTPAPASATPRLFRTEAQHRVEDHRPRGVSVERIIPIHMSEESPTSPTAPAQTRASPAPAPAPAPSSRPAQPAPVRRLISSDSVGTSNASECSSPGEPIKKSAREFIIPIAVEGKGYVTPRQRSLEPESPAPSTTHSHTRLARTLRPRRISSLVSGGESEEEDDSHMHRLRPSRLARADSASSGEEDEEDEGFHLLTAENLFSTLLHRVRALTQRLNGEEGPGFPQHPHSLFNNLQSPFTFSPHLPRRHLLREGWGSRDLHADFDSMFNKSRQSMPRGSRRRSSDRTKSRPRGGEVEAEAEAGAGAGATAGGEDGDVDELDLSAIELSEREMRALHGLTPALSRRLQRQLLASLPPGAARSLRRTLSLHAAPAAATRAPRSHSACPTPATDDPSSPTTPAPPLDDAAHDQPPHYSTLPRPRRRSTPRDITPEPEPEPEPEPPLARRTSIERPLLSKYLTPERNLSLDDPPTEARLASNGPRRSSLRLTGETPRKRVSRFLRSDFFDAPSEDSAYARHRKEKELETQKILREIREKRGRAVVDSAPVPVPPPPLATSPVTLGKDRSRSGTPFFPSLDNIKETTTDVPVSEDSKLTRPKSYPVKRLHSIEEPSDNVAGAESSAAADDSRDKRESRIIRPKSYPTTSPSPEKSYASRAPDSIRGSSREDARTSVPKDDVSAQGADDKPDVEVSFSITLPRKKPDPKPGPIDANETKPYGDKKFSNGTLVLKKYQVVTDVEADKSERSESKIKNGSAVANGTPEPVSAATRTDDTKSKSTGFTIKKEDSKKAVDSESSEKKGTMKKKIIRKVSSKSKSDLSCGTEPSETKPTTDKKKVTKKAKEKVGDEDKSTSTVPKKKSMLQSIGHKLEKLASSKSSSPEKLADSTAESKKDISKQRRTQREQSVPVAGDPPPTTESNLIKRAVTLTDVAALDVDAQRASSAAPSSNKTTVSKVLGLFRKFEPKDKTKPVMEKSQSVDTADLSITSESAVDLTDTDKDKPRRPTSLLLNGLGRKNKYGSTASDSITDAEKDEQATVKKEDTKNSRNSLKLDFSRLPRVKKIVPTNSVIEPQIMNTSSVDDETEKRDISEKVAPARTVTLESILNNGDSSSRSRSRSRSTISNSEIKSDLSAEIKSEKNPISPSDNGPSHPFRNHESTTPEKEDIVDRIRRKSFYSRFNEKKHRRKSNLVGPGAVEYDPLARIHAPPTDYNTKYDISPTSPPPPVATATYDLSPSAASDLSPSTERYRTLLADLAVPRTNYKYDGYTLNDKIDTYRSLDRNDFRKYPGTRSYLDYDQPLSYGAQRYSRTKSLLDSSEGTEDILAPSASPQDRLKYNRTVSMYTPGNYATYRPKRTAHNPAIILKESEKEPSPENVMDKIRQRKKISISVTRKPDSDKESLPRSPIPSKGESDCTECSEKAD